jgi:hypothetical protein
LPLFSPFVIGVVNGKNELEMRRIPTGGSIHTLYLLLHLLTSRKGPQASSKDGRKSTKTYNAHQYKKIKG